ncbi:hypothetical protein [Porticoccus sp.]
MQQRSVTSRVRQYIDSATVILIALALGACATGPAPQTLPLGPLSDCQYLFIASDKAIARAEMRDQGPRPVPGFPYLRVDRFLSSFRHEPLNTTQLTDWVGRMAALDASARRLELKNLGKPETLATQLDQCRTTLVANLLQQPPQIELLRQRAVVQDDYVTALRVAGLYPLSSKLVAIGINHWHRDTRQRFSRPLAELPVRGELMRWGNPVTNLTEITEPVPDALGIPQLDEVQLQQLFRRHAPIWEIDVVDHNDLIGSAQWRSGPVIDTTKATQYQLLSYSRFEDQVLLQLNYIIWFRSRPGGDIYAGQVDGLTWRVTLGPDGEPWLYDSMHNCGCYHQFFPTAKLQRRDGRNGADPPLVPQPAPMPPLVVRLESRRHFIQRVYRDSGAQPSRPLALADYDLLRALPTANGHRSLFGRHGLVRGSQRPERLLLWPMGIRSAGAMRQWGRHAVAFVGRRHFDDPRLIESLFKPVPPP